MLRKGIVKNVRHTGTLMVRLASRYHLDVAPFSGMSPLEFFEHLKKIPYNRDPDQTEYLQRPYYTLTSKGGGGDCLAHDTRLLTPSGYVNISDILPGDIIQGKTGWTKVLKTWDKGTLPAIRYNLNNGGFFTATKDHILFDSLSCELKVSELTEETELLSPVKIVKISPFSYSPDELHFIGLFLADGWKDETRICISGKDGHPKEAQKLWVKDFAERMGWKTSWHPRYIRVMVPTDYPAYPLFATGDHAPSKKISDEIFNGLSSSDAKEILSGLYADSHQPSYKRSGFCYSTSSESLAKQVRVLLKMQGFSCRISKICEHGGFGKNPIYRIYPRFFREVPVKLESCGLEETVHVYDIETEDHGIYLPDADIIVHNCDDKAICAGAYAINNGYPFRFVAMGRYKEKPLHHVATDMLIGGSWIHFDPTYEAQVFGLYLFHPERKMIIGAYNGGK